MRFTLSLAAAAASLATLAAAAPTNATDECCFKFNKATHEKTKQDYLAIWAGELSLLDSLCEPDMNLYQDRFPTANGSAPQPIGSSQDFLNFVKSSRSGWDRYGFDAIHWVANENQVVIRWKLDAIVGAHPSVPTTLKEGAHVTYNGTDYLTLDKCTGRIQEIDSAQDFVTLFHNLGLTSVNV